MLKKLLTACALVIAIAPQVYASQNWETVGKTNTGETLSLDSNSVQSKPNTGGWLFFSYKLNNRQNIGKTASCSNGKLSSTKPGWIVDSNSRQVFADSVASQELLQRVCMYGKMANYTNTNYNETDEADQDLNSDSNISTRSNYSQNEIKYLNGLNQLLKVSDNIMLTIFSDTQKIESGHEYCKFRSNGNSQIDAIKAINNGIKYNPSVTNRQTLFDYHTKTIASANVYLCPEYKD